MTSASTTDETNPRLPRWGGDWTQFRGYEQRVSLEIDSTRSDELTLLGPRLAKNLYDKGWEMIEDIDRTKLKEEDGAKYLLKFLGEQRGRDKVDLLGDAMKDLLMKQDVIRKEGEEFAEYYPRFRIYTKAVEAALKELSAEKSMPAEFYGWYLLNLGMRLEPSDIAVIKAHAKTYRIEDIEGAIKKMWSGGGLSLKDQERKKWKGLSKSYVVQDEPSPPGIYEVEEDTGVDEDDEDQEQLEDIASAMLENPEDESLLIAYQDAKKKMQYKEARKMLAKTRVSREFYPVRTKGGQKDWGERKGNKSESQYFDGDCMRCGKHGHKARNCPQKFEKSATSSKTGTVNYALACEKSVLPAFVTFTPNSTHEPIYAVTKGDTQFHGIVDSGASESIIGVDTLQELFEVYDALGFDPRAEIKVDRTLKKTFMFGNSAVSEAIGLAQLTVGLFGTEHVIDVHVVDGSAPLLLSSKFLYQMEMTVDFKSGAAWLPDRKKIQLERAPSYHLMLPILNFRPENHEGEDESLTSSTEGQECTDPSKGQPSE